MGNLNEYEFNTEVLNANPTYQQGSGSHGELMEVSNEMEFENFLGNVWNAAKKIYNSPQGQAVKKDFVSAAKSFGKQMFPSIGKNLGGYFGGDKGAKYGGQIATAAGNWILGDEEQEAVDFTNVVKKAATYLNKALLQGQNGPVRPMVVQAINQAARPYFARRKNAYTIEAPYQNATSGIYSSTNQTQGRWIRKANKLILLGVN